MTSIVRTLLAVAVALLITLSLRAQPRTDSWLQKQLSTGASPLLQHVLNNPDSFHYQVIYTRIDRDKNNQPHFTNFYLNVDGNQYFNPASTVKLPTLLVALEKLNTLRSRGIDRNTTMLTDSSFSKQTAVLTDSTAADGKPSIANYIKKILLVSDNDAYNRLYEFTGQQLLNTSLWNKGYGQVRITRRFVPMSEEENRHTNAITFVNGSKVLYRQPAAYNPLPFNFNKKILVGKAHYNWNDELINEPFDFTTHNNLPLQDLQQMLRSLIFPSSVDAGKRFTISSGDRQFVLQYMSQLPSESKYPHFDSTEYFDSYAKFFLYRAGKQKPAANIRIFNKPGWSYGFLTDAAYIVDFEHKLEFMLAATIYVNRDGVLNDNKYEYEEIGYPFFKEISENIYQYELSRPRKVKPNLSAFVFDYK